MMEYREQVERNIDLAGRYLNYLLDRPKQIETIPDGATLILVDTDDAELTMANLELAEECRQRGAQKLEVRDVPTIAGF
jgi:hypothetical protein